MLMDDAGFDAQRALREHPRREAVKTKARAIVQAGLDTAQFRVDTFPRLLYQPLPWLEKNSAGRAEGTVNRWNAIQAHIEPLSAASAVDLGCQAGYFAMSLCEIGIPTIGIDIDDRSLRMARYAARHAHIDNLGLCSLRIDDDSVTLVPTADIVLMLSLWHHWVYSYGLGSATSLLTRIWDRCNQVMFFETGETEMPSEFGLPDMGDRPADWVKTLLDENCPNSTVEPIGRFKAFGVGGNENEHIAYRTLFAVTRNAE